MKVLRLDYFTIRRVKVNIRRTANPAKPRQIYQKPRIKGPFGSWNGQRCILCGEPLAWRNKLRLRRYELSDMHRSCKISGIDDDNKHR
tara:strand:- start:623 stop:886 length:264 start_codon:yes stop_codon:yes gene_type:complete